MLKDGACKKQERSQSMFPHEEDAPLKGKTSVIFSLNGQSGEKETEGAPVSETSGERSPLQSLVWIIS